MADYTIISDISNYILELLRKRMCPEPIPSPNNIEVSSPSSQDVDYILGLYLYDVREEDTIAPPVAIPHGKARMTKPPKPFSLYYMVFVNSGGQAGLKDQDFQKIIGKVAQVVSDNNSVLPSQLQNWLDVEEPPISFTQAKIGLEEKVRVWSAINKPYQISLFYKAAPVFVSSEVIIDTPRVTEAEFHLSADGM